MVAAYWLALIVAISPRHRSDDTGADVFGMGAELS
jgi:hypothetical protein